MQEVDRLIEEPDVDKLIDWTGKIRSVASLQVNYKTQYAAELAAEITSRVIEIIDDVMSDA